MPETTCTEPSTTNTTQNGTYRQMSLAWSGQLCGRLHRHMFHVIQISAAQVHTPNARCCQRTESCDDSTRLLSSSVQRARTRKFAPHDPHTCAVAAQEIIIIPAHAFLRGRTEMGFIRLVHEVRCGAVRCAQRKCGLLNAVCVRLCGFLVRCSYSICVCVSVF